MSIFSSEWKQTECVHWNVFYFEDRNSRDGPNLVNTVVLNSQLGTYVMEQCQCAESMNSSTTILVVLKPFSR